MKFKSLCLVLLLLACGDNKSHELKAFNDGVHDLSLVEGDDGYRFQVCKDSECVNPFYLRGGEEEAVFADIPDISALSAHGKMLVASRRALELAATVVIAVATMIVVPTAAYKALKAILSIGKKGAKGVESLYDKTLKKMHVEAKMRALRNGKPIPTLKDTEKGLKFLQSKFTKFLSAFIAVQAVVGSVEFGVSSIKSLFSYMRDSEWGATELLIARNFSHMILASELSVKDVKRVLSVLRKHLDLVFSDEYLELIAAEEAGL